VLTPKDVLAIAEQAEARPAPEAVLRIARIVRHALQRLDGVPVINNDIPLDDLPF
jgi:hypothetical protein